MIIIFMTCEINPKRFLLFGSAYNAIMRSPAVFLSALVATWLASLPCPVQPNLEDQPLFVQPFFRFVVVLSRLALVDCLASGVPT